jgi:CRISPR type III-A/MTUBE-associated protein Csm6
MPQTNFRDGSLLHICRVYQPTDVYLYMSAEILANHRADNRYLYCLENLAELQGRKMACQIVERPELRDVQVFDWFYQDFRKAIKDIAANMDETDVLLLNVSSGTPAMKSGLLVLATLGEYPCKLIQVRTPMRKMNEHRHEDYDIETLWDLNEDNEEGFENRCQEIKCPSLSLIKQEEIIKKLVRS